MILMIFPTIFCYISFSHFHTSYFLFFHICHTWFFHLFHKIISFLQNTENSVFSNLTFYPWKVKPMTHNLVSKRCARSVRIFSAPGIQQNIAYYIHFWSFNRILISSILIKMDLTMKLFQKRIAEKMRTVSAHLFHFSLTNVQNHK